MDINIKRTVSDNTAPHDLPPASLLFPESPKSASRRPRTVLCVCLLSRSPQSGWLSAWSLSLVALLARPLLTGEHEQQQQRQVPQAAEEQFP